MPTWGVYAAFAAAGAAAGLVAAAVVTHLAAPAPDPEPTPGPETINYYVFENGDFRKVTNMATQGITTLAGKVTHDGKLALDVKLTLTADPQLLERIDRLAAAGDLAKLVALGLDRLVAVAERYVTLSAGDAMTPEETKQVADEVNKTADGLNAAAGAGEAP